MSETYPTIKTNVYLFYDLANVSNTAKFTVAS